MTGAPYQWRSDKQLAVIKQHSFAKHEVSRAYLVEYFQTLVRPQHDAKADGKINVEPRNLIEK